MFLHIPPELSPIEQIIANGVERNFVESIEARVRFMRLRGVTGTKELEQIRQDYANERQPYFQSLLENYLEIVPKWLEQSPCPLDVFEQVWKQMNGEWNQVDFERLRSIAMHPERQRRTTYLHMPAHMTVIEQLLADGMEKAFADSIELKLQFMRQRGVTDSNELAQIKQDFIAERLLKAQQLFDQYLRAVPKWLEQHPCSDDEFEQVWTLMGGVWNSVEFERIRTIVRIQYRYPQVLQVAKVLGREAEETGPERVALGMGNKQRVPHSAPSDIEGIGVGNDLAALLPMEMAQMADHDLDGLFAYKFATRRLQIFGYKSQIMNPNHKLRLHMARQKGPMVVCLDTSSSMQGVPTEVANSLVVKLLTLADRQKRDLLLIPFAVSARPFDVRKNRSQLLDFFRKEIGGGTDATAMLQLTIHTLCSKPEYGCADVLLVSDFQIPMPSDDLMRQLYLLRDNGTKFFGLQIGETLPNPLFQLFDRIWHLPYESRMAPWYIHK